MMNSGTHDSGIHDDSDTHDDSSTHDYSDRHIGDPHQCCEVCLELRSSLCGLWFMEAVSSSQEVFMCQSGGSL